MKKLNQSFKITAALFISACCLMTTAQAQKYSDYPSDVIYTGAPAKLKFSTEDGSSLLKTRITQDSKAGVNFGGEYNVVEIGCGTSCLNAFVVNLKSGKIIRFPRGGEPNYHMQLNYNSKSRLIKAIWMDIDDQGNIGGCVIEYFEINKDKFKKVKTIPEPLKDNSCDAYMD